MNAVKSIYMLVLFVSAYFWLFTMWFLLFKGRDVMKDASEALHIPLDRIRLYHWQMTAMVFVAGAGWCGWLVNLVGRV
jgi:hypothetical protein